MVNPLQVEAVNTYTTGAFESMRLISRSTSPSRHTVTLNVKGNEKHVQILVLVEWRHKFGGLFLIEGQADGPFPNPTKPKGKTDEARLEGLLERMQKILPPGWSVSSKLANRDAPSRPGWHPTVVIQSKDALPVEHFYPGMGPDEAPKISREKVTVFFVASRYVSWDQYAVVQQQNESLLEKRRAFRNEKLKFIPWGYKGAEPIPPDAFEPRTKAETRRIREYAFLWISTQPKPLPTHFAENLSFEMHLPGSIEIHDPKKSQEYKQLLESVEKIIVPYAVSH